MIATICPECRQPVPSGAPGGQCPACLLKRGMELRAGLSPAFGETTPQGGQPHPLTAAMIAPCFPQMEILELLGRGGMGSVFKARQTKLDRLVAVKLIRPERFEDSSFAERFMREAKTLARLNHPGIVGIHDFGEIRLPPPGTDDGSTPGTILFYFIMEFVDGANLRQLMQSGPLSPPLALNVTGQICEALQYAHEEGIIHRDIKPENILLDARGRVKLADFGLAKLADRSGDDWTLTGTHQVMGTPQYMAPEQFAGSRHVDHRADIYSLAVVLYEMLTGTIPFGHFAPPSKKAPVDPRLDNVILTALSTDPDDRFPSARDLRSAVIGLQATSGGGSAGLSTIIDRQVVNAWNLVAGGNQSPRREHEPFEKFLYALAALGCLGLILTPAAIESARLETSVWAYIPFLMFGLVMVNWLVLPRLPRVARFGFGISVLASTGLIVLLVIGLVNERPDTWKLLLPELLSSILIFAVSVFQLWDPLRFRGETGPKLRRGDFVNVTPEELQAGILPDLCVVCGQPASGREMCVAEVQPKWAEAASAGGYLMGGVPGMVLHMMTSHDLLVSLPTCEHHSGLWRRRNLYASLGWLLVPVLAVVGHLVGMSYFRRFDEEVLTVMVLMGGLGLVAYLIPVIWMSWHVVKVRAVPDGITPGKALLISIQRICTPFASEVRRRQRISSPYERAAPATPSAAASPSGTSQTP